MCVGLILGTAGTAAAQGRDAAFRRLQENLPADAAARVGEIGEALRRAGVPPGLVYRKALEGIAKGIPPGRLLPALRQYAGRLREARAIMGPGHNPATLGAAAEAIRRGVPADAVRSLTRTGHSGRDLAVPLIVLGELTEAGVPTDRALDMVSAALNRGARADRMLAMSAAIRRRIRRGDSWQRAVEAVRRRALEGSDRPSRARPDDGGGQVRRYSPNHRQLDAAPVPPGSNPPTRLGDRHQMPVDSG